MTLAADTETVPYNKLLEHVIRTPGRQPSPQPVHLLPPHGSQPHLLSDDSAGYVAPKFEGKEKQMEQGKHIRHLR